MTPNSTANPDAVSNSKRRYEPGELIEGKYKLVRPLGHGGMGTVWVAHNTVLDVAVALKLITLAESNSSDELAERLLREARASARLGHGAIVRVFDFGRTQHGDPFIVMELLHGESVATLLNREGRVAVASVVQMLLPIADALSVAHGKGVIHRDVKPENVIVCTTEEGRSQPKLLDFGIATIEETSKRITEEKRLTREGSIVGTPAYMSPEQAMGKEDIDHRSDVWSFSVMFYELITGELPFDADNYNALLYEIIHTEPRPTTMYLAGDDEIWAILRRGLGKKPEERWDSIRAMGEALAAWLVSKGITEDVCGASLTSAWLASPTSKASPDLVPAPESDPGVALLPPLAAPPARPKPSRRGALFLGLFAITCFAAGFSYVRATGPASWATEGTAGASLSGLASPQHSPDQLAQETTDETPGALQAEASEPEVGSLLAEGESSASAPALPVDEALGDVEPAKKRQKKRVSRPRKAAPSKGAKKSKDSYDFGF